MDDRVWPEEVVKVCNSIANQFEAPVLFYVLCLVINCINAAGTVAIAPAWLFALSRYAHAYMHVGCNYVPMRFRLFLLGGLILLTMVVLVAWELAAGGIAA